MPEEYPSSRDRGYEVTDASVRGVIISVVIITAATLAVLGIVRLMMTPRENAPASFGAIDGTGSFTYGPEMRSSIQQSWEDIERNLVQKPDGYAWIDRERGIVSIPIERAMKLIAEENGEVP